MVIKRTVPNDIIKAFVTTGEINKAQRDQLLERAERNQVVSLYIRPLK